jgi:methylamine dehydrogenase accessory protein MauD
MGIFWLVSNLMLWLVTALLGFLLLGALRAVALLRWQVEQLEATTPSRLGRSGLRRGTKAPSFTLPTASGDEISLNRYADRKLLLVFMQPGCGPCHSIVPELNRLHDVGEIQVLVIHNGAAEAVREWIQENRPRFPVAVQDHFEVSKRYEAYATPFAFLIDERGVVAARGIVSTKQFLGFVLAAGHEKSSAGVAETLPLSQASPAYAGEASLSNSKAVDHV